MALNVNDNRSVIDGKISALVEEVREQQRAIVAAQLRIEKAKQELTTLLLERGSMWKDENGGYARLATATVRVVYDKARIDALILSEPLMYGWLKDYRKETSVKGGVQVR